MRGTELNTILTPKLDSKLDKTTFYSLSIGCNNILPNSKVINYTALMNKGILKITLGAVKQGETFVFSFDSFELSGATSITLAIYKEGDNAISDNPVLWISAGQRQATLLTIRENYSNAYLGIFTNPLNQNNGTTFKLGNVMLVRGNKATNWMPSPLDMGYNTTQSANINMITNELTNRGGGRNITQDSILSRWLSLMLPSIAREGGQHERSGFKQPESYVQLCEDKLLRQRLKRTKISRSLSTWRRINKLSTFSNRSESSYGMYGGSLILGSEYILSEIYGEESGSNSLSYTHFFRSLDRLERNNIQRINTRKEVVVK